MSDPTMHPLRKNNKPARVLVVEDQLLTALDITDMVEELGGAVVGTAITAAEALTIAQAERPDLVLMDVSLAGETDGVELAHVIRERFDTPVIFITGNAEPSTAERVQSFGNAQILLKPIDAERLREAVQRIVIRLGALLAVFAKTAIEFG